jgi:trk system potassium uptake protein TrkH
MASLGLDMADALFESVSAVTTTGATVISGLDSAPPGLLLWRSLLQWIGGIGIVALGLLVLPYLKVGGFTVFKMESSDTSEKPFARFAVFVRAFFAIYIGLTLTCAILYRVLGMSDFDALNHAMTTLATGGFSTHDASFGAFPSPALIWTGTVFMAIAGLPFSVLILFAVRGRLDALRDPQIFAYGGILFVLSIVIALSLRLSHDESFGMALTHATFNVVSIVTTTGYASADYTLWGPLTVAILLMATFLGGCSGSTSGGIKAYRLVIIASSVRSGLMRLIYPQQRSSRCAMARLRSNRTCSARCFSSSAPIWASGRLDRSRAFRHRARHRNRTVRIDYSAGQCRPGHRPQIGPSGNFSSIGDAGKLIMVFLDAAWPSGNSWWFWYCCPGLLARLRTTFNTNKLSFLVSH